MRTLSDVERAGLVSLFRDVSPLDYVPEPALPPPWLAGLEKAPLPHRPRAILFDLYGTLFASAAGGDPGIAGTGTATAKTGDAARRLLEGELLAGGYRRGVGAFTDDVARHVVEMRDRALERHPFPEIDIEEILGSLLPDLGAAARRRLAILHEAWRNPCALMPGAPAILGRLRREGIRLGIVSNAQFYTPLLFEALFGADPQESGFETMLTVYSFETGIAKPDGEIFARAAAPLLAAGLSPSDILVVGNSAANDVAPAAAFGFMTALFAGDGRSFRPAAMAAEGRPDILLAGLDGLGASLPPA